MKKPVVIILAISILCLGIIGVFMLWKQKQKPIGSSSTQPLKQAIEENALWEDQAGFSFNYPKTLSFNKHDEDVENYAHIEFTSAAHAGRLIVWAKDTTYEDVSEWVKNDKGLSGTSSVDTTLGGLSAKKIIIPTPSKKVIIGTISDQILFTIEAEPSEEDPYWTTVSDMIVSSFVFTQKDSNNAPSEEAIYDEEEVVE